MIGGSSRRGPLVPAILALAATFGLPVDALETDRVAVEQLPNESPTEASFAFEDACYRVGVNPTGVRPVQVFTHAGGTFVRLRVSGPQLILRCLNSLARPRRGVDGSIHWFDGFAGGRVLPAGVADDRIPDSEWYSPSTPDLPRPAIDTALVEELAHGSGQARTAVAKMPVDAALIHVRALIDRGGPGPLAALEEIAREDPHARVRRAAVEALTPGVSADTILAVAGREAAWQVRLAAVDQLGALSNAGLGQKSADAGALLLKLVANDPDWTVRRECIWVMSTALVKQGSQTLHDVILQPIDARVRAAALEALAGAHLTNAADVHRAMSDVAPEVRAIGAEILMEQMRSDDVRALWVALNDPSRLVRIAVAPFLYRVDDKTIAPDLWTLYGREADEVDADPEFERALLDALARQPFSGLGQRIQFRLKQDVRPEERRLLARTLAIVSPELARALLEPLLAGSEAAARSIAADALPDSPSVHARRLQLLEDPDSDVRAGTLLGLCRASHEPLVELATKADLDPTELGHEAMMAAARCGQVQPQPPRIRTSLLLTADEALTHGDPAAAVWPALAAIVLLMVSVVALKVTGARYK